MLGRYAWAAISEWQCSQGVTQRGRLPAELLAPADKGMRRARSVACMTQLQAKQTRDFEEEADDSDCTAAAPDRCCSPCTARPADSESASALVFSSSKLLQES